MTTLPPSGQTATLADYYELLDAATRDFARAAARSGQYEYMWGALTGFVVVIAGGGLLAELVAWIVGHSIRESLVATALACGAAGALGSCASVSWRVTAGETLRLDPGAGTLALRRLGTLRPAIGAAFGAAIYFALKSGFLNIGAENRNFYSFAFFAFVAGFSERLIPDLIRAAERRIQTDDAQQRPTRAP
jgi:hypothetical protein